MTREPYEVIVLPRAGRELRRLSQEAYQRVLEAIRNLANEPRPTGCRRLKGREGWRIRVGSYRVIYQIDDEGQIVTVLRVRHRREAYR